MGAEPPQGGLKAAPSIILVVLLGFTIALVALSIPAGFYAVFSGNLASSGKYLTYICPGVSTSSFSASTAYCPYLWVGPVSVFLPRVISAGAAFALFTAVYVLFLLYGVYSRDRPWTAVSRSLETGVRALFSSPFIVMMVSVGFLIFAASLVDDIVAYAGLPIGSINGDPLALFVGVTYAPLVEELGFRVVLVGLVAMVVSLGRPLRQAAAALWRPSIAMEGLPARASSNLIIWGAMGVSAVAFGYAHVAYGGWQIGKLPEATFGGAVLGYVYVRYGLPVAVVTHWGIDYFGSAFSFFGQAAYGIPWNSGTEYIGQTLVDYDMLLLFGLASFLLVMYMVAVRLAGKKQATAEEWFNPPQAEGEVAT